MDTKAYTEASHVVDRGLSFFGAKRFCLVEPLIHIQYVQQNIGSYLFDKSTIMLVGLREENVLSYKSRFGKKKKRNSSSS